jgi:hypothetical protein
MESEKDSQRSFFMIHLFKINKQGDYKNASAFIERFTQKNIGNHEEGRPILQPNGQTL